MLAMPQARGRSDGHSAPLNAKRKNKGKPCNADAYFVKDQPQVNDLRKREDERIV